MHDDAPLGFILEVYASTATAVLLARALVYVEVRLLQQRTLTVNISLFSFKPNPARRDVNCLVIEEASDIDFIRSLRPRLAVLQQLTGYSLLA